jgi:VWFA-related protein
MRRSGFPSVLLAAAALTTAVLFAQGGGQVPPVFRTQANYVRVDVFPTLGGAPVADLTKDDFAILDNGVPQTIEQFERVVVPGNVPQNIRRDPSTAAESRQMLQDARARVLVLFLDTPYVDLASSRRIGQPLADLLAQHLGEDDLVGLMTPEMRATDVTFARKTTAIERVLANDWWGDRDRLSRNDPTEERITACYPSRDALGRPNDTAQQLIERYREQRTLDALEDLVQYVGGVRDERKAILVITSGWRLFSPAPGFAAPAVAPPPQPIGIDPGTGRLGTATPYAVTDQDCESTRMALTSIDSPEQFRRMLAEANRANASFYPIDPQGLAVFDSPLGPAPPPSIWPSNDAVRLRERQQNLRTLAADTDGLAIVGTNDLSGGIARVVGDLTSYYLLGYYATNVTLDGAFHRITVRVKRPGIAVRARSGYLAPSEAEVEAAAAASASPAPARSPEAADVDDALDALARFDGNEPLFVQVAAGMSEGRAVAWIVGDVPAGAAWAGGAELDAIITGANGDTVGAARGRIEAGMHSALLRFDSRAPLEPGEYRVSVRARALEGGETAGADARVAIADGRPSGALVFRRGPATGNRDLVTADLRFRRSERVRIEVPSSAGVRPTARLLDRTGAPLAIPVAAGVRDADGTTWATAEFSLAPLAPGDYLIAMDGTGPRTVVAFRVIR